MRVIPDLSISPEKVFFVISKSRRSDSEAGGGGVVLDFGDDDMSYGRGGRGETTDRAELAGFIRALNVDEQIDLVALAWLGRGDGDLSKSYSDAGCGVCKCQGEVAMDKMRIDKGDWLVVCDGRKALILENLGDEMFPNLHTREVHEQPNPATAAQGAAAPGRSHGAAGGARSSIEQTDWHDEAERAFLRSLAGRLDAAVSSGETTALTMVASPRALGMIRADYSEGVRNALQGRSARTSSSCRSTRSRSNCCGRAQPNKRSAAAAAPQ